MFVHDILQLARLQLLIGVDKDVRNIIVLEAARTKERVVIVVRTRSDTMRSQSHPQTKGN